MKLVKHLLILAIIACSFIVKAERPFPNFRSLSENSKISLLTCDPGNQLYTTFGHSAIRVYDPMQGKDIVFNYGTFNFNVPNFYLKFTSGKLLYRLSYETYRQFMAMYVYESRTVIEQDLDLTLEQRQILLEKIRENYKIENRFYKYDFFFDNCATRIIDMYAHTFSDSLIYVANLEPDQNTFRTLLGEYLTQSDWSSVGINLLLGKVTDVPATELQKSFLPDYLLVYMHGLQLNGKPFVKSEKHLLKGTFEIPKTPFLLSPKFWFWFILGVVFFLSVKYKHKAWVIADRSIFILFGFFGLLVFLATFATDHDAMRDNLNLLWINPLYLLLAGLIGTKHRKLTLGISLLLLVLSLMVLLGWSIIPQTFDPNFIPLILLLLLRLSLVSLRLWNK